MVTVRGATVLSGCPLGALVLRIGVLGVQGAFTEHVDALRAAFEATGIPGEVAILRKADDLASVDAAVLPGGESTTISKLLVKFGLHDALVRRAREEDFPILGTCAGLILLSKEGDGQVEKTETRLLGLMDMATNRNAFGRQRESFEADVHVKGLDAPFHAVFIRAPAITRTWGACETLGALDASVPGLAGRPVVAARQGNRFALAFHPELTPDARLHAAFVRAVAAWKAAREAAR